MFCHRVIMAAAGAADTTSVVVVAAPASNRSLDRRTLRIATTLRTSSDHTLPN